MHVFYRMNAEAHDAKAQEWLSKGNPEYADGSMRKAAKWRQKGREMDMAVNGPFPKSEVESIAFELMLKISIGMQDEFAEAVFGGSVRQSNGII